MHDEPSELKISASPQKSWLKNLALQLRSTAAVVVLVSWLIVAGLICIFAEGAGLRHGIALLAGFLGFYMAILSRGDASPPPSTKRR